MLTSARVGPGNKGPVEHQCVLPDQSAHVTCAAHMCHVCSDQRGKTRRFSSQRLPNARIVVDLNSEPAFTVVWILLFIAHSACIAFLVGATATLRLLRNAKMDYFADLLRSDLEPVLHGAEHCIAVLIGLHALQLVLMLMATLRERRFQFTSLTAESLTLVRRLRREGTPQSVLVTNARLLWRVVFGRSGFFGVENPYYEWRYAVGECIEIVTLSLQAYSSSSHFDPHRWIVDLYLACAVCKCWSTPVVLHVTARWNSFLPARRLACVLLDAIFDSGTAMLFPLLILLPYAQAFDISQYGFATELMYDDIWWINFVNETRQIFPLDTFDLLVKLVPHMCVFTALKNVRSLVRRRDESSSDVVKGISLSPRSPPASKRNLSKMGTDMNLAALSTTRREVSRESFIDRFFFLWALGLLACHFSSRTFDLGSTADRQCLQPLKPWFVRKQACSLYMFNCYSRATESVHDDDLEFLHRPSLAVLVFAHCPALRMTASIQAFPKLLGVEVYNSTLVDWGANAAISSKTHPVLSFVFIIRTNMSEIPIGIRGTDLPSTLMDIEFSVTNLTSVPDDLDVVWSHVGSLYIENSRLTSIPAAVLRMPLYDLSFIGNEVDDVSSVLTMEGDDYTLSIAMNPVQAIPNEWESMAGTGVVLNLVETGISTLPDWFCEVVARTSMTVILHGTPFCEALSPEEALASYGPSASISCSLSTGRERGRYPLNAAARLYQP